MKSKELVLKTLSKYESEGIDYTTFIGLFPQEQQSDVGSTFNELRKQNFITTLNFKMLVYAITQKGLDEIDEKLQLKKTIFKWYCIIIPLIPLGVEFLRLIRVCIER